MASVADCDGDFSYSLTTNIPFPSSRLANIALQSLSVDEELSSLVTREFSLAPRATDDSEGDHGLLASTETTKIESELTKPISTLTTSDESNTVLKVHYKATTPRMLRVAVNGFFESLSLIVQVMEELDHDVLHEKGLEDLEGVQGVEQGLTGTALGVTT